MFLHSTSTLNSEQQLQELLPAGGKGRVGPLGFNPLALEMWREREGPCLVACDGLGFEGPELVGVGQRGNL